MVGRPTPAGPKSVRELFHYAYRWLTSIYDEVGPAVASAHPAVTVTDSATIDITISSGQVLSAVVVPDSIGYAHLDPTVEADILAGGGFGLINLDGGSSSEAYLLSQVIDGGSASSIYLPSQVISGGPA